MVSRGAANVASNHMKPAGASRLFLLFALLFLLGISHHAAAQLDLGSIFTIGNEDPTLAPPRPSITRLNNGGVVIVYEAKLSAGGITGCYVKVLNPSRNELIYETQVQPGVVVSSCTVASNNDDLVMLVWSAKNVTSTRSQLWIQRIDGNKGESLTPPVRATFPDSSVNDFSPAIAYIGGARSAFVLSWIHENIGLGTTSIYSQLLDADGQKIGSISQQDPNGAIKNSSQDPKILLQNIPQSSQGRVLMSWTIPDVALGTQLKSKVFALNPAGDYIAVTNAKLPIPSPTDGGQIRMDYRVTPLEDGMTALYTWLDNYQNTSFAVRACLASGLHLTGTDPLSPCANSYATIFLANGVPTSSVSVHGITPHCGSKATVAFTYNNDPSRLFFKFIDPSQPEETWNSDSYTEAVDGPLSVALVGKARGEDCSALSSTQRPWDDFYIVIFGSSTEFIYAAKVIQYRPGSSAFSINDEAVKFRTTTPGGPYPATFSQAAKNAASVVLPDGNMVHVYEDWSQYAGHTNSILSIVRPDGTHVMTPILILNAFRPCVAISPMRILVTWTAYTQSGQQSQMHRIEASIFDFNGEPINDRVSLSVSATDKTSQRPTCLFDPTALKFVVAWSQYTNFAASLRLRHFGQGGVFDDPDAPEQIIDNSNQLRTSSLSPVLVPAFNGILLLWNSVDIGTTSSMIIRAQYLKHSTTTWTYEPNPGISVPTWNPLNSGSYSGFPDLGWYRTNLKASRVIDDADGSQHIGLAWEQKPVVQSDGQSVGNMVIAGCIFKISANENAVCTPYILHDEYSFNHVNPAIAMVNTGESVGLIASWLSTASQLSSRPGIHNMRFGLLFPNSNGWTSVESGGQWLGKEAYIPGVDMTSLALSNNNDTQPSQSSLNIIVTYRVAYQDAYFLTMKESSFFKRDVTVNITSGFFQASSSTPSYASPITPVAPISPPTVPPTAMGGLFNDPIKVSNLDESLTPVSVQLNNGNIAVLVESHDGIIVTLLSGTTNTAIYSRKLKTIGSASSHRPEIADAFNGQFLIVWEQEDTWNGGSHIWAQIWRGTATESDPINRDPIMVSNQGTPRNVMPSAIRTNPDDTDTEYPIRFLIVWTDQYADIPIIRGRAIEMSPSTPSRLSLVGETELEFITTSADNSVRLASPKLTPFRAAWDEDALLLIWRSIGTSVYTDGLHAKIIIFGKNGFEYRDWRSPIISDISPNMQTSASSSPRFLKNYKVAYSDYEAGLEMIGIVWSAEFDSTGNGEIRAAAIRPSVLSLSNNLIRMTISELQTSSRTQRRPTISPFAYSHSGSPSLPGGIINGPAFLIGWEYDLISPTTQSDFAYTDWYPYEATKGPIVWRTSTNERYPSLVPLWSQNTGTIRREVSEALVHRKDGLSSMETQSFTFLFLHDEASLFSLRQAQYLHTKQNFIAPTPLAPVPPEEPVIDGGLIPTSRSSKSKGLGTSGIIGIAVGFVVAVFVIFLILFCVVMRRGYSHPSQAHEMVHMPPRPYETPQVDPTEIHPMPVSAPYTAPEPAPVVYATPPPVQQHYVPAYVPTPSPVPTGAAYPSGAAGAGRNYAFEPSPYEQ